METQDDLMQSDFVGLNTVEQNMLETEVRPEENHENLQSRSKLWQIEQNLNKIPDNGNLQENDIVQRVPIENHDDNFAMGDAGHDDYPNELKQEEILLAEKSVIIAEASEDSLQEYDQRSKDQMEPKSFQTKEENDFYELEAKEAPLPRGFSKLDWREHLSLTENAANRLGEQLRLILHPTLPTKFEGDFKTGKRLNMKKIIPYIASEYRKDKIWMRRTKPSKRAYQILIALDDSKSMRESGSIKLAFNSLALLAMALSRIDVGELGVLRFGEQVEEAHSLGTPFVGSSGDKLIEKFTFSQSKTDIAQLLQTSIDVLMNARETSRLRNNDLWQLEIIISDGICENHAEIARLVRQALDVKIFIVFIVLDDRDDAKSILQTSSVTYEKKDGKLQMKMTRYLETFPFDYYIVLKHVEELPEVLADTLRQFFSATQNR